MTLDPTKPAVIQGADGVSQKASGSGKASHYVSFTRLTASGDLELDGAQYAVGGSAWMDHEWFTAQLDSSQVGWDWFSIQLDDGRDLMLFQLRDKNGTVDPYSSGTIVDARGAARHLTVREFSLEPGRSWVSPKTRARYPVSWRIRVPLMAIDLQCDAVLDGQELTSADPAGTNYWEGAVRYSGSRRRRRLSGDDRL